MPSSNMTTNWKPSLALVLGSLAGLVTMAFHPTGAEVTASLAGGGGATLNKAVHSLALLSQPLMLMGTLALTLRLTVQRDLAVAAFILFAWSSVAIMMATAASGFIATAVLEAGATRKLAAPDAALLYTGMLNHAFARIYVAFSSAAIVIWSAVILRAGDLSRPLGVYGLASGAACLTALLTGHLGVTIHGFGSVVLAQGVWFVWVAVILRRPESTGRSAGPSSA